MAAVRVPGIQGLDVLTVGQALGFALADEYQSWGGPLRYNFHTVRVAGERPFDVW